MSKIETSCEIGVPVRTAYDQWTRFEDFPHFMEGVESVHQLDDKRLEWRALIGGKSLQWTAEIVEQSPDRIVAWRSTSGAQNEGVVTFESLGASKCRVTLKMTVHPDSFGERVGNLLGVTSTRVKGDLDRFKEFVERNGSPAGGWRGEIHGSEVIRPSSSQASNF